jgi:hypothetical protein
MRDNDHRHCSHHHEKQVAFHWKHPGNMNPAVVPAMITSRKMAPDSAPIVAVKEAREPSAAERRANHESRSPEIATNPHTIPLVNTTERLAAPHFAYVNSDVNC